MENFESLTDALTGQFASALSDLPQALQQRIRQQLFPLPWDSLTVQQRQSAARQWDAMNEPAGASEREYWFDFHVRRLQTLHELATWEAAEASSVTELTAKESRIKELRASLAEMDATAKKQPTAIMNATDMEAIKQLAIKELRSQIGRKGGLARANAPGGSEWKKQEIRAIWATGNYKSRDECASEVCEALGWKYSSARNALANTPDPVRKE